MPWHASAIVAKQLIERLLLDNSKDPVDNKFTVDSDAQGSAGNLQHPERGSKFDSWRLLIGAKELAEEVERVTREMIKIIEEETGENLFELINK